MSEFKLDMSSQTQLLAALLGSSLALAINQVVDAGNSNTERVLLAVFLMANAANFFHGKSQILNDPFTSAKLASRIGAQVIINASNLAVFVCFSLIASKLSDANWVLGSVCILRLVDAFVVGVEMRILDRSVGKKTSRRLNAYWGQRIFWFSIDLVITLTCLTLLYAHSKETLFFWQLSSDETFYKWTAYSMSLLIAVDIGVEYGVFGSNYFSRKMNWDDLAERWDRMQGELGDWYRIRIIYPRISESLNKLFFAGLVDIGCGNGCASRYFNSVEKKPVVGFDPSEQLLEIADLYPKIPYVGVNLLNCTFEEMDKSPQLLDSINQLRDIDGNPLLFLSLFSFQDCNDYVRAFDAITDVASPLDRLIIVTEALSNFDADSPHATTLRHWKYSLFKKSARQIVYWTPVVNTQVTSRFSGTEDKLGLIPVETSFRSESEIRALMDGHWRIVTNGSIEIDGLLESARELRYSKNPKFNLMELERI